MARSEQTEIFNGERWRSKKYGTVVEVLNAHHKDWRDRDSILFRQINNGFNLYLPPSQFLEQYSRKIDA